MDIKRRLQAELDRPDGSTGSGQEIRTLVTEALVRIKALEHGLALRDAGCICHDGDMMRDDCPVDHASFPPPS